MFLAGFLGAIIGLILGITGAGGGILAVPALVVGLGFSMTSAAPVALMAVGTSAMVGALHGLNKKLVRYKAAIFMALLGTLFSHLGVHLAHILPDAVLMTLFSATMFLVALRMIRKSNAPTTISGEQADQPKNCMLNPATGKLHWTRRCAATLGGIGATTGMFAGMLGVGGGFIIVPAFKRYTNIDMHHIVATSLMTIALISTTTVLGSLAQGVRISTEGWVFVGAAVLGMVIGRIIAPHTSSRLLQMAFGCIAGLVSVILLIKTYFPGALG